MLTQPCKLSIFLSSTYLCIIDTRLQGSIIRLQAINLIYIWAARMRQFNQMIWQTSLFSPFATIYWHSLISSVVSISQRDYWLIRDVKIEKVKWSDVNIFLSSSLVISEWRGEVSGWGWSFFISRTGWLLAQNNKVLMISSALHRSTSSNWIKTLSQGRARNVR